MWEENGKERRLKERRGEERSVCEVEELKEGATEELLFFPLSSDVFKADPLGLLFLGLARSPSPSSRRSRALFPHSL